MVPGNMGPGMPPQVASGMCPPPGMNRKEGGPPMLHGPANSIHTRWAEDEQRVTPTLVWRRAALLCVKRPLREQVLSF